MSGLDESSMMLSRLRSGDASTSLKELWRVHELWNQTKQELKASRRELDTISERHRLELLALANQHQQVMNSCRVEMEVLRAELKLKADAAQSVQMDCANANSQLTTVRTELVECQRKASDAIRNQIESDTKLRALERRMESERSRASAEQEHQIAELADELHKLRDELVTLTSADHDKDSKLRQLQHDLEASHRREQSVDSG